MSVLDATRVELERLGCVESVEGQRALNLAKVLDDRAGIQGGGLAATDKQLGLILAQVREEHKPQVRTALSVLRSAG